MPTILIIIVPVKSNSFYLKMKKKLPFDFLSWESILDFILSHKQKALIALFFFERIFFVIKLLSVTHLSNFIANTNQIMLALNGFNDDIAFSIKFVRVEFYCTFLIKKKSSRIFVARRIFLFNWLTHIEIPIQIFKRMFFSRAACKRLSVALIWKEKQIFYKATVNFLLISPLIKFDIFIFFSSTSAPCVVKENTHTRHIQLCLPIISHPKKK